MWRGNRASALLALLASTLAPASAAALSPDAPFRALAKDVYRDRDGLPQNAVRALVHAASGGLWIATDEGLARFDGAHFEAIGRREDPALPSDLVTSLAEADDGTLWIGTYDGGLVSRRAGLLARVAIPGAPPGLRVNALWVTAGGGTWVASGAGAFQVEHTGARGYTMADGLPDDRVSAVAVDRDGTAWLGTRRGLARVVAGRVLPGPAALRGVPVGALAPDPSGGIWAGTTGRGLARVEGDSVRLLRLRDGLPSDTVSALVLDRQGVLWIGTQTAGLARLRGGVVESFGATGGLPGSWISTLLEDREGSIWVGTQDAGLLRLREADFVTLGAAEGLSHDSIESVLQARNGDLWVASDGGVDLLPGGRPPARRVLGGAPMSLWQDRRGDVWIGTIGQGLWRWRDGAVKRLGAGAPPGTWYRALLEDGEGTLWAATTDGLYRLRGERLEPVDEGLPAERLGVVALALGPGGQLYVATEGAGLFRRGGARFVREEAGPPEAWVVSGLHLDDDGTLWAATEGGGLWRRRAGQWKNLTSLQGLHADTGWTILDDGLGQLWISSNRGVYRVKRAELDAVLDGQAKRVSCAAWGMDDGLRSQEAAGLSHPGGWRGADGRLWFATLRGVSMVDPSRLAPLAAPPEAAVQRITVAGLEAPLGTALRLPPDAGRVELEFTARLLLGQARARFRYRMLGLEEDWTTSRSARSAQYARLPPGRYRFEVQARLADGPWGPTTAVELVQRPARWRTASGLLLGALLLLAALLLAWLASRRGAPPA